ncbi:MAG: hypothetical protein Q8Q62_10225 [Mesorhizobium sp.]|nr:hypothetical protein [Mesorhizobium sp.]
MTRLLQSISLTLATAASVALLPGVSAAADQDQVFFESVEGVWTGPGEIVAGKYKGTKFTCKLNGTTPSGNKVGMTLDGSCRVGVFSQRMSATVERKGRGYRGKFLDGAGGAGLDIVSGNVDGRKVVLSINRNDLNGAMMARLPNRNSMNVSVSVKVDRQMVRVIAMDLKRVDDGAVSAVASE